MPRPWCDHFRFFAPFYDRVFDGDSMPRRIASPLNLPVAGWLLDAGGGTGRVSQAVAAQTGGVVVADVSSGMLRQARRKGGLHPTHAQAEQLPFASGGFERILIVDAFHHFYHQEAAARELWRVLRPGGRLVLLEPNIERWPVRLVALGEKLLLMRSRFLPAEELARLFTRLEKARVVVNTDDDPLTIQLIAEKLA